MNAAAIIKTQPNRRWISKKDRWTITDSVIPWIRENVKYLPEFCGIDPTDVYSVGNVSAFAAVPIPIDVRGLIPDQFVTIYCTFRLSKRKNKSDSHYHDLAQYDPKINIVGLD